MSLPSFSFGAEGVEYGRKASFYELSSGPVVLPSDLEVKGNLLVDGSTILTGPAVVNNNLTVSGNETVGGAVTILGGTGGTALTVGQGSPGGARDLVVTGTAFTGLINSSTVTATQGGTGGTAGLVVTNGGIGGNPVRSVSVFNDQASPGTLISMRNGADAGTVAYTGTAFELSRPLTIPVQVGSSGNLTVGGVVRSSIVRADSAVRRINLNVSDNVTDPITIPWAGVTEQLMGVIQGAGANFSVNYVMPADLLTNNDYIGMTIAEGTLVFTGTRVVGLGILLNDGVTVIVSGFISTANTGGPYTRFKVTKTTPSGAFPYGIYFSQGLDVNTQVG